MKTIETNRSGSDWRESYFAGNPLRIGNDIQFLFDDYLVEDRFGLKRVAGPVEKHTGNPLDTGPAMPWDSRGAGLCHVVHDPLEERYKAWYVFLKDVPGQQDIETGYNYATCYAESADGLAWTKPALDLFPYAGLARTNIVLLKEGTAILENITLDPAAKDPDQRFSALVKMVPPGESARCIVRMVSPDGRKWSLAPDLVLFRGASDSSYSLVRDDLRGRWMLFRRPPTHALKGYAAEGFYAGANDKRRVSVSLSLDMRCWTHPCTLALPDELDVSDIDSVHVIRRHGMFLGFIGLMNNPADSPKYTHLMWSRDGLDWDRLPDRPRFIENGAPGEWDAGSITVSTCIPDGDRVRIYYIGVNVPQAEKRLPRMSGTGLAWIGKDRWIGQQAGPEGGYLLTRRFILEGDRLEVNCRCQVERPPAGMGGLIRAELLRDPVEHLPAAAYPGFGMDDCDPAAVADNPRLVLTWKGSPDLSTLCGKPVYIRFYIRNAALYAFRLPTFAEQVSLHQS